MGDGQSARRRSVRLGSSAGTPGEVGEGQKALACVSFASQGGRSMGGESPLSPEARSLFSPAPATCRTDGGRESGGVGGRGRGVCPRGR